jgi:hypothetical protein
MLTNRANALPTPRLLAGALVVAFILAACSGAAAPSANPTAGPAGTPKPTPTAVPGDPGNGGTGIGTDPGSGGGGGSDPGTGGGIVIPIPQDPNQNPLLGDANYVTPGTDLVNQHPINVQMVRASFDADGTVTADLRWYSGVAPCNQLDRVEIERDDAAKTIRLRVIEGSGPGDMVCIDIAELRATTVDLDTLASGTWTISAEGDAPAIKLDIP